MLVWILVAVAVVAAAGLAWALFEAQWVELLEQDAPVPGLPAELDGFRILHISDFHLGTVSLNGRALGKAVDWAAEHELDLVAVTGDLVSRRRGVRTLVSELGRLRPRYGTYAVLGNHDVASTRDPFSRPADLSDVEPALLLEHESVVLDAGSRHVQVAGGDPRRHREPHGRLADREADLRILLVHFPDPVGGLARGDFQLILAGHLHGGQICLPTPRGKLRLEHLRARYWEGLYELPQGTLHVSRGLGASFVPFRLLARPEATILTLRPRE
ncbi:MAG: metallophosphoesterase [Gaiellaceae bacterium]